MLEKTYKQTLTPLKDYVNQSAFIVSRLKNITIKDARKEVIDKAKKTIDIPIVEVYIKDENKDKHLKKMPLTNYIEQSKKQRDILAPSFTRLIAHDKELSVHSNSILKKLALRVEDKRRAAVFKAEGDSEKASFYSVLQKSRKIFNNAFSGGYSSKGTNLHNPTGHSVLTSMTRGVASIGNSVSESIVGGNKMFDTPEAVMGYISTICLEMDKKEMGDVIKEFSLKIPTDEDIFGMILYSSRIYWKSEERESTIRRLISTLDDVERCGVMYINDLYSLRLLNPELMHNLLEELTDDTCVNNNYDSKYVNETDYETSMLMRFVLMDDLRGQKVEYTQYDDTPLIKKITGTIENIKLTVKKYEKLISSVLLTKIMPINIVHMKDMVRRVIVLSDTDSTCGSYTEWIRWYFGKLSFDRDAITIASALLYLVTMSIRHNLSAFAANMNIPQKYAKMLAMKNEYYWNTFVPAIISKHYFSDTLAVEGLILRDSELETKGKNLVAAAIPEPYKTKLHDFMVGILKEVTEKAKLSILDRIKMVADIERDIIKRMNDGDYEMLLIDKIQTPDSYSQPPELSNYRYLTIWNETFGIKYGKASPAPTSMVKLKVMLGSKRKFNDFIEKMEDKILKEAMIKWYSKHPAKTGMETFRIPTNVLERQGIPEEIKPYINYTETTNKIVLPFYIVLQTIGFHIKPDILIKDLGY